MPDFWPHDFATWVSTGGVLLTGLWWVLKNTIVTQIRLLREDLRDLKNEFKKSNNMAREHERRIGNLEAWKKTLEETWKHDHWEV